MLPPLLADAVANGALQLTWEGTRVRAAKLDYRNEHSTPFEEVGRTLFAWPATEGIESLELGLASLFWKTPLLAARLGHLVTFRAWSTYETVSINWLAQHAPRLETLTLETMSVSGDRLDFPRLCSLELFELRTSVEAYRAARCPLLTSLSVQPSQTNRSVEEADALLRAFARLQTLTTNLRDLPHAQTFAERMSLAPDLRRWNVSYCDDAPPAEEVSGLRATMPRTVELVAVERSTTVF